MRSSAAPEQLIIWDFDGTILDTEWPAYDAARREYERLDVELSFTAWQDTIGTAAHEPWWEALRRAAGHLGEPDDVVLERYRAHKNRLTDSYDLLPGVRKVFLDLEERAVRSAIASSSALDWVERHTRRHGLWQYFVSVATRTDVGAERTKPNPDLFLLAAERADVDPGLCIVIEDSEHGVTAARSAGMRVLAVPNRITTGQDFSGADLVLDSLAELRLDDVLTG